MTYIPVVAAIIFSYSCAHPLHKKDTISNLTLKKRYFSNPNRLYDSPKNVRADARDFMTEVIGHALNHHIVKPDKWMDFYNNGAKWGHYISPQVHHSAENNMHDPHYNTRLAYAYAETNRDSANQESHEEAYPGELVSGENSLSKFIAPPVFDEPESTSQDRTDGKKRQHEENFSNTPEATATESSNTRKLVDSLNSFMTPLKVPKESEVESGKVRENVDNGKDWDANDKSFSNHMNKLAQTSPYDSSFQGIVRHEPSPSREGLQRVNSENNNDENNDKFMFSQHSHNRPLNFRGSQTEQDNFHDQQLDGVEHQEQNRNDLHERSSNNEFNSHESFDNQDRNSEDTRNTENFVSRDSENEFPEHESEKDTFLKTPSLPLKSIKPFRSFHEEREIDDSARREEYDSPTLNGNDIPGEFNFADSHLSEQDDIGSHSPVQRIISPLDKISAVEKSEERNEPLNHLTSTTEPSMTRNVMPDQRFAEDREEKMSLLHHQLSKLKKSTVL